MPQSFAERYPLYAKNPHAFVAYGPNANCTLEVCPVTASVYEYRPRLSANAAFLALFAVVFLIQAFQSIRWRTFTYGGLMMVGCLVEVLGYAGRIMLHQNPFSFGGFLMQIICISFGPVFYTAAIYFTLSKVVIYLGPEYARFSPKFYYWIFIPCDILSLVLQAVGGALSSDSSGGSGPAVDISLAGLAWQVFTLIVFISLAGDYAWRYSRATNARIQRHQLPRKFTIFTVFLTAAMILILARCIYRIDELSQGYKGPLIHNEPLFIGLEGVLIIISAFFLCISHPGPVFGWPKNGAAVSHGLSEKDNAAV